MERKSLNDRLYQLLIILIFIFSHTMCAVIAYNWAFMECGIRYRGYSAPASTALFSGFPYFIALLCCMILALLLRKYRKS